MATNTYVALDKKTLVSAVAYVDFTGIVGTYTDLVIVVSGSQSGGSGDFIGLQYNGDTGTNYSNTYMLGNGSTASSGRASTYTNARFGAFYSDQDNAIVNIQNYSNSTTYKTALGRSNSAGNNTIAMVNLWRNTAAITSVRVLIEANNFAVGTTFSLYGVQAWAAEATPKATGGYVYSDSTYWYHAFQFSGTFTPITSLTADVLTVAGGGGAGYNYGAGGGAGGLLSSTSQSFASSTAYTVTVGAGGAGGTSSTTGSNGVNSSVIGGAISLTAIGGGGGGTAPGAVNGANGGSGGGGSGASGGGGGGSGGAGTSGQGYAGAGTTGGYGGGGGGAGGAATGAAGANGSSAYSSWGLATLTGQNVNGTVYYAGGGSGTYSTGGYGGGGAYAVAGAVNTGGGAGPDSKPGGSGLVIVRYAK